MHHFVSILAALALTGTGRCNLVLAAGHSGTRVHYRHRHTPYTRPVIIQINPRNYSYVTPHEDWHKVLLCITGKRFRHDSTVYFDAQPAPTTFISTTQLQATIPFDWIDKVGKEHWVPAEFNGTAKVTVRNPSPHGATSRPIPFPVHADVVGG